LLGLVKKASPETLYSTLYFDLFLFQILRFFNETFIYFRLACWKITL